MSFENVVFAANLQLSKPRDCLHVFLTQTKTRRTRMNFTEFAARAAKITHFVAQLFVSVT